MKTDTEVRATGLQVLLKHLGEVDAERFISMINREKFDYTQWRQQQWQTESVSSLAEQARALREQH